MTDKPKNKINRQQGFLGQRDKHTPQPPAHLVNKIRANRKQLIGESKHVTVLVCDIVGSVALSQAMGLEEWAPILQNFMNSITEAVHSHEGMVDRYTGDGLIALFGAPVAHEDHAVRACLAAFAMQRKIDKLAVEVKQSHELDLRIRIGLHSGEIIFGRIDDDLRMEYSAVGRTMELSNRVEQIAEPNCCFLSNSTACLLYTSPSPRD